ncbi:MAG: hypothetical protein HXY40_14445 [Chloroflexi bacterium]|nr:hypothetical protein [Chloroflexota bacterium]
MTQPSLMCSQLAHEAGTQQFGSAQHIKIWFLLEYAQPFGANAIDDFWAQEFAGIDHKRLSAFPDSRWQLIKQQESKSSEAITLFVAVTDEVQPRLYQFKLRRYDEILQLDAEALLRGASEFERARHSAPLFLVCTNGKRDPCCAKHGLPLYHEMHKHGGGAVWQSSHIAGHRFAATMICFPHGIYYGQVAPSEAYTVIELYRAGQMYYEKLRGRACYPRAAQVAEYYLRAESRNRALDAFRLLDIRQDADQTHVARFESQEHGHLIHRVQFVESASAWETYPSCDAAVPRRDSVYKLLKYEVGSAKDTP